MKIDLNRELEIVANEMAALKLDQKQPKGLYEPMHYLLEQGGKRLRPLIVLLAYQAYRGEDDYTPVLPILRAVELFHNFSLLHDDVMDDAPMRRGVPTVYKKWGANTAILSGDGMLVEAYRQFEDVEPKYLPQVLKRFNEMAIAVCEGQQYDTDYEDCPLSQITLGEYMDMIRLKTSHLFMGASSLGALVAGAPEGDVALMGRGVELMGQAFQVMDDWLDVFGEAKFGKIKGGDILEGKRTWLLISAYAKAPERVSEILDLDDDSEKISKMTRLYEEIGIGALALKEVDLLSQRAIDCLDQLSIPNERILKMKNLFAYLVERKI